MSRRARPRHRSYEPVHVTYRLRDGLPSLRRPLEYRWIRACFACVRDREDFRLVHYSVQSNHLHLIVEADDADALARGLRAISVRLAKRLNAMWGRRGSLFADRYHARPLRTPREVWNALAYVLRNAQHHGGTGPSLLDFYSSADFFDDWIDGDGIARPLRRGPPPVAPPRTWLLREGWKRHGRIHPLSGMGGKACRSPGGSAERAPCGARGTDQGRPRARIHDSDSAPHPRCPMHRRWRC